MFYLVGEPEREKYLSNNGHLYLYLVTYGNLYLIQQRKIKNESSKENYRNKINEIKANAPDQNAINLSITTLPKAQESLLMKGPSFVPTLSDVNWYEMGKDFSKFVNQLRFKARNILEPNANTTNDATANTDINAPKNQSRVEYKSSETFEESMEK